MRYTTIIDISEFPHLYRSESVRLVYLHLCLCSGYHDNDRDLAEISIRRLADRVGITIGAARHALRQLEFAHLIVRQGTLWQVRKFIIEQPISKRSRTAKEAKRAEIRAIEDEERQRKALERAEHESRIQAIYDQGKTPFMIYYESQIELAKRGDLNAQEYVRVHTHTYELHKKSVQPPG